VTAVLLSRGATRRRPGAGGADDRASLDVFTRHYAGDYGKAHRDEARARMLEH
jgi:hypothetical protein